MNLQEIEQLNQLISRTDMSGNQKVEWLANYIDNRETQYSYVIKKLMDTYIIDLNENGAPNASVADIMKLIDSALVLIRPQL